jgi:hypothetical protein
MAKIIENESPMWITPLGRDETTSPNYPSAKSFPQASESEARPSVTAPIRHARSLPARSAIRKRGWITSMRVTTQTYKVDSPALTRKTPELLRTILKAGTAMPTRVTPRLCTPILMAGGTGFALPTASVMSIATMILMLAEELERRTGSHSVVTGSIMRLGIFVTKMEIL